MKTLSRKAVWMPILFLLALPVMGQKREKHRVPATAKTAQAGRAATVDPNYVIGPQDVLDINVWNEASISRTVPVRPDGKISLPLLNDVRAAGLTPEQLDRVITQDLRKYLENPQVTVIVTAINSQRFFLLGEINRPGTYQLLPDMTVLQALSDAGGFSPFARLKDIYVLRTVNGRELKFPFNYKEVLKGNHPEENLVLRPGDTIVVP